MSVDTGGTRQELFTVRQFSQVEPAFPESGLRWLIFNAQQNGLERSGALVRVDAHVDGRALRRVLSALAGG